MLTVAGVNALTHEQFLEVFDGVVEASPWVVAMVRPLRPMGGRDELCAAFDGVLRGLPADRQVAVIKAHPDLVGHAARAGTLNPDSAAEQASAGLHRLSDEEIAEFQRLNAAYLQQFGFPFVICARENRKEAILRGMASRLVNPREQEISIAIDEVCKIVRLRLMDKVSE